jgi:hypothetical protein
LLKKTVERLINEKVLLFSDLVPTTYLSPSAGIKADLKGVAKLHSGEQRPSVANQSLDKSSHSP